MTCSIVYITTSNIEDAQRIGHELVEEQLAACVNLVDKMQCVYRWEGELTTDTETIIFAKTRSDLVPALIDTVKAMHPYSIPAIISYEIQDGNPEYLKWVEESTRPAE